MQLMHSAMLARPDLGQHISWLAQHFAMHDELALETKISGTPQVMHEANRDALFDTLVSAAVGRLF